VQRVDREMLEPGLSRSGKRGLEKRSRNFRGAGRIQDAAALERGADGDLRIGCRQGVE
jgi:hypothetical protein